MVDDEQRVVAVLVQRAAAQQRLVDEGAVLPVQPELVEHRVVGDEDIDGAIAVVVGADDAKAVAETRVQIGRRRYVGKAAEAVVAVEHVGGRRLVMSR